MASIRKSTMWARRGALVRRARRPTRMLECEKRFSNNPRQKLVAWTLQAQWLLLPIDHPRPGRRPRYVVKLQPQAILALRQVQRERQRVHARLQVKHHFLLRLD